MFYPPELELLFPSASSKNITVVTVTQKSPHLGEEAAAAAAAAATAELDQEQQLQKVSEF